MGRLFCWGYEKGRKHYPGFLELNPEGWILERLGCEDVVNRPGIVEVTTVTVSAKSFARAFQPDVLCEYLKDLQSAAAETLWKKDMPDAIIQLITLFVTGISPERLQETLMKLKPE